MSTLIASMTQSWFDHLDEVPNPFQGVASTFDGVDYNLLLKGEVLRRLYTHDVLFEPFYIEGVGLITPERLSCFGRSGESDLFDRQQLRLPFTFVPVDTSVSIHSIVYDMVRGALTVNHGAHHEVFSVGYLHVVNVTRETADTLCFEVIIRFDDTSRVSSVCEVMPDIDLSTIQKGLSSDSNVLPTIPVDMDHLHGITGVDLHTLALVLSWGSSLQALFIQDPEVDGASVYYLTRYAYLRYLDRDIMEAWQDDFLDTDTLYEEVVAALPDEPTVEGVIRHDMTLSFANGVHQTLVFDDDEQYHAIFTTLRDAMVKSASGLTHRSIVDVADSRGRSFVINVASLVSLE